MVCKRRGKIARVSSKVFILRRTVGPRLRIHPLTAVHPSGDGHSHRDVGTTRNRRQVRATFKQPNLICDLQSAEIKCRRSNSSTRKRYPESCLRALVKLVVPNGHLWPRICCSKARL